MKKSLLLFVMLCTLSHSLMYGLEEVPLVESKEEDISNECPICLDLLYTNRTTVKLKVCTHVFHEKCIKTSFRESPAGISCPVCRAIPPKEKARREKISQREAIEDNETIDMLVRIERQRRRRQSVFSQHCCIIQ